MTGKHSEGVPHCFRGGVYDSVGIVEQEAVMSTYMIFTRLSPDAFKDPSEFPGIAETVSSRIKAECPQVNWKQSYVTTGQYDVVDIVEAPDVGAVERACMIIRAYGHGTTETVMATPWGEFIDSLKGKRTAATVGTA